MIQALFSRTMMLGMVLLALGIAGCTDELEEQLAAAQAERAKAEAAMSTVQAELAQAKDDAEKKFVEMEALRATFKEVEDLEQVSSELSGAKAELATLKPELNRVQSELDTLRAEVAKQHQLLSEQAVVYRTKSRSKVRARPTTDSAEVAVVPKGNSIQVYEIVEGGTWYKVGGMGYIFHELLEPVK